MGMLLKPVVQNTKLPSSHSSQFRALRLLKSDFGHPAVMAFVQGLYFVVSSFGSTTQRTCGRLDSSAGQKMCPESAVTDGFG